MDEWEPSDRRWNDDLDEDALVRTVVEDSVGLVTWRGWTVLPRESFESNIKDKVDLYEILDDISYGLGKYEGRALNLLMRHHLRWYPTFERWKQFDHWEWDGCNYGRQMQHAIRTVLLCGYVCASLTAAAEEAPKEAAREAVEAVEVVGAGALESVVAAENVEGGDVNVNVNVKVTEVKATRLTQALISVCEITIKHCPNHRAPSQTRRPSRGVTHPGRVSISAASYARHLMLTNVRTLI